MSTQFDEMEARKCTPSIIAKLMGLDDLPSQPPMPKRQRVLSENYLRKTASIGLCESRVLYSGPSSRTATLKQQGRQNAVEEETMKRSPKIGSSSFRSVLNENVNTRTIQMSSIQQHSGCTRHHFTRDKLHHLKEFVNVPEDLNQSTLLRYPPHPVLLPNQQLQGQLFDGNYGNSRGANSSGAPAGRKFPQVLRPLQKHDNSSLSGPLVKFEINNFLELLNSKSHSMKKTLFHSSRIVVFKPSSGKASNSVRHTSFPGESVGFSSVVNRNCDFTRTGNREEGNGATEKLKITEDTENERPTHGVPSSQEVFARREKTDKCYSDWESSCNKPNQINSSLKEYSFGSLAKKKMFERWRTTRNSEAIEVSGKRCSLGEMISVSEPDTKSRSLCSEFESSNSCQPPSLNNGKLCSSRPFDSNSMYGWKDDQLEKTNFKLKHYSSPATHECFQNGMYLKPDKSVKVQCKDCTMRRLRPEDILEPRLSELVCDSPESFPGLNLGPGALSSARNVSRELYIDIPLKVGKVIQDERGIFLEKDDMSGDTSSIGSLASCISGSVSADEQANDIDKIDNSSSEFKDLQSSPLLNNDGPLHVWETSYIQKSLDSFNEQGFLYLNYNRSVSGFPVSSRDIFQPSPDSVLELPSQEEDASMSEGFDSAASGFYGLAMQQQLLKLNSDETYSEGIGLAVSSDEAIEKGSVHFSQDTENSLGPYRAEETRNFSYLLDVLDEAGLFGVNVEICLKSWHYLEDPVDPTVFEALEKRYGKQTSWLKSERRLLFDRINAGLKEILRTYTGFNFWSESLRRRISAAPRRDAIDEVLWLLLIDEDKEARMDMPEKFLESESKWLQLTEDLHTICKDIEIYLFNELLEETANTVGL